MDMRDYFKSLEGFREELKHEGNPTRSPRQQRASQDNGTRQRYATGGDVRHRSRFPGGGDVGPFGSKVPVGRAGVGNPLNPYNPIKSLIKRFNAATPEAPQPRPKRVRTQGPAPAQQRRPPPLTIPLPQQQEQQLPQPESPISKYMQDKFFGNHYARLPEGRGMDDYLREVTAGTAGRRSTQGGNPVASSMLVANAEGERRLKEYLKLPATQTALEKAGTPGFPRLHDIPLISTGGANYGGATARGNTITYHRGDFSMPVGAVDQGGLQVLEHNEGFRAGPEGQTHLSRGPVFSGKKTIVPKASAEASTETPEQAKARKDAEEIVMREKIRQSEIKRQQREAMGSKVF